MELDFNPLAHRDLWIFGSWDLRGLGACILEFSGGTFGHAAIFAAVQGECWNIALTLCIFNCLEPYVHVERLAQVP